MEVRIQAIHFDATQRLEAFIQKKAERLARHNTAISVIDVTLKVVKPETAMNKEAVIKVSIPTHEDIVATKVADTFEEAVDLGMEALDRQLEKRKEKK
ncbi:MAG: ribosome-associated translation inhibitor RaiA [Bacteroidales bacterium]|nr:ribosome-associated translation inhibitor RaiA [Bacteroidales bacterium]